MSFSFEVIQRPLTKQEAKLLVQEVRKMPNITGYTVKEWLTCKHVFVAIDHEGQLLGACMNDDFASEWTEIAVLIVLEGFRRRRIGRAFLEISIQNIQDRKRNMMIISREPNVLRMMKEFQFDLYTSLSKVDGPYKQHKFILSVYYQLRSMMSVYRFLEVRRKKIIYGIKEPFIYGLRHVGSPIKCPLEEAKAVRSLQTR